ncbi:MAG: polynucleotide kinase-phosphatase, partial [Propionibacteriaceae bacterium]|nr:polynucleotide kinase-phosphatase [Propionibacteriaceae bacterium]
MSEPRDATDTMSVDGSHLTEHDLAIPELSLVLLVGASGSGKSTFAAQAFAPFEVVSSDYCRGVVSNDPTDQNATADAFALLHEIVATRLRRGLLTVVDATNVQPSARKSLIALAKDHDVLPVAIVLDIDEKTCIERNKARNTSFGESVVHKQVTQLRQSLKGLGREGLRHIHILTTPEQVEQARIVRTRLFNDLHDDHGPFDVIGDVHGCLDELVEILSKMGYDIIYSDPADGIESGPTSGPPTPIDAIPPEGRRVIFLGDLIDRGPNVVGVLRLAMGMTKNGHALAVPGNHEAKLVRALGRGAKVQTTHGLVQTLADLEAEGEEFTIAVRQWCDGLISHYVLDDGRLVVAHAGLKEAYQGRASGRVRAFALYGDTTGESDEYGLPVRYPWANDYRGKAMVLYGHTPIPETQWVNNTLCLDTGCVFGGSLSALRYPEKELVQVKAARVYAEPVRPLRPPDPEREPDIIDATDVLGRRTVQTRWMGPLTIQAEQGAGAFEVMSRFAAEPRRLAYLPPTMSPVETSHLDNYLEHPLEAFAYFAKQGVGEVICEEKHMGSRAVAFVNRIPSRTDIVHTRTGRPFFAPGLEEQAITRLRAAVDKAGLWDEWDTDWVLLDAELLPWSLKAESLIRGQYLP